MRIGGHRRTGQPHHVGQGHRSQHHTGQQQPRERRLITDGYRGDAQPDPEDELRQEPQHEDRDRDDDQTGDQHRGIEDLALAQPGDHSEADAEHRLHCQGNQRQPDGHRKRLSQNDTDRQPGVGAAQIAVTMPPR